MTPKEIGRLLAEEEIKINDNQIYSLLHHVEDAIEAFDRGEKSVARASLLDIKELAEKLSKDLSPKEKSELD